MKYLFIDTNIYIQCCLLELEGDDLEALNKLHKLLEKNKVKLLLPEVVELELYNVLEKRITGLKNNIGKYKENINKGILDKKIKTDLIEKIDECVNDREKNTEKVRAKLDEIFKNKKFTVKKDLIIKESYLVNAYKLFLSGKKPFKEKQSGVIQPDCVIIETLVSYFQDIKKYELFFCSSNKSDFVKNPNSIEELIIHDDIVRRFKHIKYYGNLYELLNEEFGGDYSEDSINKLEEKEREIYASDLNEHRLFKIDNSNVKFIDSINQLSSEDSHSVFSIDTINLDKDSSLLETVYDIGAKSKCNCCGALYNPSGLTGIMDLNKCDNCRGSFDLGHACSVCGRHYHHNIRSFDVDNGKCDECQTNDLRNWENIN